MYKYIISIYDIERIDKPVFLKEVTIKSESKEDAQKKGHDVALKLYPIRKRMISSREFV